MTNPAEPRSSDLDRPSLPEVTRLNRNVLVVAGLGVAVIVLAVTHVVRGDRNAARRTTPSAQVEAGTVGSFLNDAPRADSGSLVPPPAYPEGTQSGETMASTSTGTSAVGPAVVSPYGNDFAPAPRVSPREEAYQRALKAGLRAADEPATSMATRVPEQDPVASAESFDANRSLRTDAGTFPASPADRWPLPDVFLRDQTPAALQLDPPRTRDRHEQFLDQIAHSRELSTYMSSRMVDPVSEYQIMAGTVIPAMLVTAMNSDMPGEILAQISRNIFDSQQRHLLIPRGTRVIGRYDSQVALGQSRVLIAWTRLIFPDGRSITLPGLPTKDLRGASGMRSQVDNHYGRLYGQAVLLSIIGAGAQLSQPQQSSVFAPNAAGQVAAGALGQELSRISMESIRRNMDVRPTLEVKPGTPFYIFLERDLAFQGPYVDRRTQ
jgi:type IV secretory pathway VirB10-like protein